MARKSGFERPWRADQITAWVVQPIAIIVFLSTVGIFAAEQTDVVFGLYIPIILVGLICWLYCQSTDPATPGGIGCPSMRESQSKSQYCSVCKQSIPGMDHHCKWLNICVGKKTYFQFYTLSVCGTLGFAIQSLVSLLLVTTWRSESAIAQNGSGLYYFLVIVSLVSGVALFAMYANLCRFHTQLLWEGKSTYDWMLARRQKEQAEAAARRGDAAAQSTRRSQSQELMLP